MAKADVLALVSLLGGSTVDATLAERYYRDTVLALGQSPVIAQVSLLPVTPGVGTFTLPASAVRLLGVLYDDEEITEIGRHEVAALDADWRNATGTPGAYYVEDATARTFRLYPVPIIPSKSFIFLGEPLGTEYPEYAVVVIHTDAPTDIPVWLELPVALAILAKEFLRESNHRDPVFATLCRTIADSMLGFL